jgi:DNA replication protein DnaC
LPIDKFGVYALFQVISQRYEHGSTVITTSRAFKQRPEIFNNDRTLTSALLDRLLHHALANRRHSRNCTPASVGSTVTCAGCSRV